MHCRTLYNYNQWLGDFFRWIVNRKSFDSFLIFLLVFRVQSYRFRKQSFFLLWVSIMFDFNLLILILLCAEPDSNVQPFRPPIGQSRNEVIWSGIDWDETNVHEPSKYDKILDIRRSAIKWISEWLRIVHQNGARKYLLRATSLPLFYWSWLIESDFCAFSILLHSESVWVQSVTYHAVTSHYAGSGWFKLDQL